MEKTSTVELGTWIMTRRQAILTSERKAKAQALANTQPIHYWFKPLAQRQLTKAKQWFRDKLLFDPFNKKKKHKPPACQPSAPRTQASIQQYFTLLQHP